MPGSDSVNTTNSSNISSSSSASAAAAAGGGAAAAAAAGGGAGMVVDPAAPEFVEGWSMVQTLGEGAFGEVKLLINRESGEAVALKMVDLHKHPEAETSVKKEMLIHKLLKHVNIIKFFGSRREGLMQYIFLEYAVGGELFDRIEPDVGMPTAQAQSYFRQLVCGVVFLHSKGVAHRDIKPENILLDASDVIKITDFGMATLFRHAGRERLLTRRCGTRPYMAPEVLQESEYRAQPADVWCCGVVLVALLAGELPWDEPSLGCREYRQWHRQDASLFSTSPWTKLSTLALALLRKLLHMEPSKRCTLGQILDHGWMAEEGGVHPGGGRDRVLSVTATHVDLPAKRKCSEMDTESSFHEERISCSLPTSDASIRESAPWTSADDLNPDTLCFSQPDKPDHLLLASTHSDDRQYPTTTPLQRLVRRMTRVLVSTNLPDTMARLNDICDKLRYRTAAHSANVLTVSTTDRRGAPLVMKATVLTMGAHTLVDVRRSKGCGLDFKRQFIKIKEGLKDIAVEGAVTWSIDGSGG